VQQIQFQRHRRDGKSSHHSVLHSKDYLYLDIEIEEQSQEVSGNYDHFFCMSLNPHQVFQQKHCLKIKKSKLT
jgi:hypothetical protein